MNDMRNQKSEIDEKKLTELESLFTSQRQTRFGPFFAARVKQKILEQQRQKEQFDLFLTRAFRRVLVAGAVAAAILLTINVVTDAPTDSELFYSSSNVTLEEQLNPAQTVDLEELL